jgi:hypothetical protein
MYKLMSLFIRKRFSMASRINSGASILADKINRTNKKLLHPVITFLIDPSWIKGRKEGSYLLKSQSKSACWQFFVSSTEKITSVIKPARRRTLERRPPPYRCHPVDGLRTSSTDKADLYSLSGPARPRLSVTVTGTVRSPSP